MEILSFEGGAKSPKKKRSLGILMGIAVVAGVTTLGSTLAASVAVSGGSVTFGQGVAAATACDASILVTPAVTFDNDATLANAQFKLSSITLSDVDTAACDEKTFVIKAYGESVDTALTLFATNVKQITSVIEHSPLTDTTTPTDTTLVTSTGTLRYNITTPSLNAADIYKITIEQQ